MDSKNLRFYFFYLASFIVILAGVKIASEIIIILFLAVFIASIFSRIISFLEKKHFPKIVAYMFALSIFLIISLLLAYTINISLKDFATNFSSYEQKFRDLLINGINFFENYGYKIDKNSILEALDPNSFLTFTTKLLGSIGTFLSKFLLIVIGIAFILAESKSFEQKLKIIFKNNGEKLARFKLFSFNIQKYFIVKTTTSFLTGLLITIALVFFKVDYPILWGVIAMLFNFIPVIGSIIAAVPAIILSLINLDINTTILITLFYLTINISISNIIEPKFMGKELGLSPLIIFFSLIFWGWMLGIVGMFLAVPITMTLKIAFESNSGTKWLAILMSNLSTKKER